MSELRLPFLGTTQDHEVFEYILLKLKPHSALIALPNWLVNQAKLSALQDVNLHLTGDAHASITKEFPIGKVDNSGIIHPQFHRVYTIRFALPLVYCSQNGENKGFPMQLVRLERLFKNILFLKKGVYVYVKHMIPFFSRIIQVSKDKYKDVKKVVLEDFKNQVSKKVAQLTLFFDRFSKVKNEEDLAAFLDFEELNGFVQSELDVMLFELAFEKKVSDENVIKHLNISSLRSCHAYINSIKILERNLYSNYNSAVIIYSDFAQNIKNRQ